MLKYSHDQKEKAFNAIKEAAINDVLFSFNSYEELEKSQDLHYLPIFNRHLEKTNSPYLPELANKLIKHPLDIEYFKEFSAPLMEHMHSAHYTNVNSTITFFGPMMYFFARAIGAEQILEVGMAEGYTSWYLANAVKDNATRFKMAGNMYYGLEILDRTTTVKPRLDEAGLPNTILQMDSIQLSPDTFKDVRFDMIFLDGCHDKEHIIHEAKVLYPQLKGEGNGFMLLHDVYGPGEEGCKAVIEDPNYNWEFVRICEIYGLAILRKMDGYKEGPRWRE